MMTFSILLTTSVVTNHRALTESDVHFPLHDFHREFYTRATRIFRDDSHLRKRLFDHEKSLAPGQLQTFLVTPAAGVQLGDALREALEARTEMALDSTPVGGHLVMHGSVELAQSLRAQPEVMRVVPLLPELKVAPHFERTTPNRSTVSLNVMLLPHERHGHLRPPAADLATTYAGELREWCAGRGAARRALGSRPSCAGIDAGLLAVKHHSEKLLEVTAARDDAHIVAAALAERPEVTWIEPHMEYRVLNADGVQITQSGSNPIGGGGTIVGATPMWDMGLHGEGQVVGVGDSGLDGGSCYFENAAGGTPGNQQYGDTHRKVQSYRAYADGEATGQVITGRMQMHANAHATRARARRTFRPHRKWTCAFRSVILTPTAPPPQADHGTHVVGSILGEASVTTDPAAVANQGVAYKARVAFTDIGPGDSPGLAVPNDLVNNFFNVDYDEVRGGGHPAPLPSSSLHPVHLHLTPTRGSGPSQGARIHSNSWGANINAYTIPTRDVDEFMALRDDMLILFAAGNSGTDGPGSVGAPATCKNCVTVGASENSNSGGGRQDGNVAVFSSQGPGPGGSIKPDVVAPGFLITSANSNDPAECGRTEMAGTSMATPITSGNAALLRQYLLEGWYPSGTKGGSNPKVPSGALMKAMLINSAVTLGGTYQQNQQLGPGTAPGNVQATPPDPNRALAPPRLPAAPF